MQIEVKFLGLEGLVAAIQALGEARGGSAAAPAAPPAAPPAPAGETAAQKKKRLAAEKKAQQEAEKAAAAAEAAKTVTKAYVLEAFAGFFNLDKTADGQKRLIAAARPLLEHFGISRLRELEDDPAKLIEALGYAEELVAAFKQGKHEAVEKHRFAFQADEPETDVGDVL